MRSTTVFLFFIFLFFSACESNNKSDEKKISSKDYEINNELSSSGEGTGDTDEGAKLDALISESKKTLDSIDAAYAFIRKESRLQNLSLDEREQVNEVLIELNDAKDLIILEMEQKIINDLKEKTNSLQLMMQDMNARSAKLMHIAQTLSRVSSIISKTTNLLAGALAVGLVRPSL